MNEKERLGEIDARLAEIDARHRGRRYPHAIRDEWNGLNRERDELRATVGELDVRRRRLAEIANSGNPAALEQLGAAGQDPDPVPTPRPDQPAPFVRLSDRRPAAVAAGQSFADHPVVAAYRRAEAVVGQHGSLGSLLNSMSTTSGSAVVPTVWASRIIDRARNIAAVMRAG